MIVKTFDVKVDNFIKSLEKPTISKYIKLTDLLERFGSQLPMPYSKKISSRLFELRIRGQQEVRIFYAFRQDQALLLHGFVKKTQKTPQREIKMALNKLKSLTTT
jgi:phage-related protein